MLMTVPLVNLELEKNNSWLCANKLFLNIGKSLFTIFSSKNLTYYHQLFVSGQIVPFENNIKLLGVIIDNTLNFSDRIGAVCTKLFSFYI